MIFRGFIVSVLSICLAMLAGCAEPTSPLRIGINAWPGFEYLYLAKEKGFYTDAGVEVKIVEFESLADTRRAFERGQIDGWGNTAVESLIAADQSNRNPKIIQITDYSDGADVILAQSRFESMSALKGARVGVELGSICVYVLARALEIHGLKLQDITPVSLDQASMVDAFSRGEIDAVVTYPPYSVSISKMHSANKLFSTNEIPGEVVDVIAVDASVIESRSDDVRKLVQAYQRAVDYAFEHPEDANPIMAKREGIPVEEFNLAVKDGIKIMRSSQQAELFAPAGGLSRVVATTSQLLFETGQIKRKIPVSDMIDNRFIAP